MDDERLTPEPRTDQERLTQELRTDQQRREAQERELERSTEDEHEAAQHARRADKAAYLREKLEQREQSEREASS